MAETIEPTASDFAEQAPAAAAEAAPVVAPAEPAVEPAPAAEVTFPARARRKAVKKVAEPASASAQLSGPKAKTISVKPAAKKRVAAKAKPAAVKVAKPAKATTISQLKDKIMATKKTQDFTEGFKTVVAEAQTKAQEAFEKSSAAFGEAGEFAKGNVEALVESTKILGIGLKDMGEEFVQEAKSAYESMTADAKELAAVKSPVDFFKLQAEIMRRSFDAAVAQGSKNTEAMMKLANDSFAPISGRISLAVEKVKKAA